MTSLSVQTMWARRLIFADDCTVAMHALALLYSMAMRMHRSCLCLQQLGNSTTQQHFYVCSTGLFAGKLAHHVSFDRRLSSWVIACVQVNIVLEYINGGTLLDYVNRHGKLSEAHAR